jgi:hypothetical protein
MRRPPQCFIAACVSGVTESKPLLRSGLVECFATQTLCDCVVVVAAAAHLLSIKHYVVLLCIH